MDAVVIEDISMEYKDKLKVVKVNVDENTGIADEYNVQSIPTLMLFKNGSAVNTMIGFQPKPALEKAINKVM
jgi:thioredoxin 1